MDSPAAGRFPGDEGEVQPYDFRRLFITELVGAGLPLHPVASPEA